MDFAENQKEKKGGEDSDSDSLSADNLEAGTDNRNVTPQALREITGESPQDYLAELFLNQTPLAQYASCAPAQIQLLMDYMGDVVSKSRTKGLLEANKVPHLWNVAALALGRSTPCRSASATRILDNPACLESDMISPTESQDPLEGLSSEFVVALCEEFKAEADANLDFQDDVDELKALFRALKQLRLANARSLQTLATMLSKCANKALQKSCAGSQTDVMVLAAVRAGLLPVTAFQSNIPEGLVLIRIYIYWCGATKSLPRDTAANFRHLAITLVSLGLIVRRTAYLVRDCTMDFARQFRPNPLPSGRSGDVLGVELESLRQGEPRPVIPSGQTPRRKPPPLADLEAHDYESSDLDEEVATADSYQMAPIADRELRTYQEVPREAKERAERSIHTATGKDIPLTRNLSTMLAPKGTSKTRREPTTARARLPERQITERRDQPLRRLRLPSPSIAPLSLALGQRSEAQGYCSSNDTSEDENLDTLARDTVATPFEWPSYAPLLAYLDGDRAPDEHLNCMVDSCEIGTSVDLANSVPIASIMDAQGVVYLLRARPNKKDTQGCVLMAHVYLDIMDPANPRSGQRAGYSAVATSLAGLTKYLEDLEKHVASKVGNLSGLRLLVDSMAHWALANIGASSKTAAEQHMHVTSVICLAVQHFLVKAAMSLIADENPAEWTAFGDTSTSTWYMKFFVEHYRPLLLVPKGLKFNAVSLQSILIGLGHVCPDCGLAGFISQFCPTKACWDRNSDVMNGCFNTQFKAWCAEMDDSEPLEKSTRLKSLSNHGQKTKLLAEFRASDSCKAITRTTSRPNHGHAAATMEDLQHLIAEAEPLGVRELLKSRYGTFLPKNSLDLNSIQETRRRR